MHANNRKLHKIILALLLLCNCNFFKVVISISYYSELDARHVVGNRLAYIWAV